MQMKDGLAGFLAIVDNQPEGIAMSFFFCDLAGNHQQMSKQFPVGSGCIDHLGKGFFGDHQNMYRCLGIDIPEGEAQFILVNYGCRYFPFDDLAENSVRHDSLADKLSGKF